MKNYALIIFAMFMVTFTSCQTKTKKENTELKQQLADLKGENDKLRRSSGKMEVSIDKYKKTLAEIDKNLAGIAENQALVGELKKELKETKNADIAKTINSRISSIREMMENSRIKMMSLDKSLSQLRKQGGAKSEEILALDQRLDETSKRLIDKQNEITELRNSLEKQLEELGEELENQILLATELKNNLNRAYYYISDSKTLREKDIVNKEGGFIGLGRVKVINAEASDSLFNKAEKDQLKTIELNSKKAKLITSHPEDSYELVEVENMIERLNILNFDAFWKDSNYLVIEVDRK
jgi:chromosome segregation ATPase